jgi:hypothetical protein
MRVLICGIVGAAVAAAAWLGLEHWLQMDIGWLALAVGLVTGLSVHKAAGAATGGGYARGGFAALLVLAAIVGGRQLKVKVLEAVGGPATAIAEVTVSVDQADDSDDAATGEATDLEVEFQPNDRIGVGAAGNQKVSLKKRSSQMEIVWMCGAALVAYIIGKGGDPVPADDEENGEQSGEQSQDDSGE